LRHTSLWPHTDRCSTHYDHHSVSLSAGIIISTQSFTSKNAVFFYWRINNRIPAATSRCHLATASTSKTFSEPQSAFYAPITPVKTAIRGSTLGSWPFSGTQIKDDQHHETAVCKVLRPITTIIVFTANYYAINQVCLTIIAG